MLDIGCLDAHELDQDLDKIIISCLAWKSQWKHREKVMVNGRMATRERVR
jgi:hypothetical protein